MKQKILVTGAGGQLGKELNVLSSSFPQYDFLFLSKEDMPIDDAEAVSLYFKEHRPQYFINCAAYTAVDKAEAEKELAFKVNSDAVGLLARMCKENHTRFIHISTDYVFDGNANTPYKEDAPVNPQSVYGASKLEGEKQAIKFDPDTIIIRTSWVYSPFGKNFVRTMLKLMKEKKELGVVNDQFGSPTYAADLAGAICTIISSGNWIPGIYHYSNKGIISWYDLAVAIKEITDSECAVLPIPSSQYPTPAKRPAYSALDNTKIQQAYNIGARDWKDSLRECLARL